MLNGEGGDTAPGSRSHCCDRGLRKETSPAEEKVVCLSQSFNLTLERHRKQQTMHRPILPELVGIQLLNVKNFLLKFGTRTNSLLLVEGRWPQKLTPLNLVTFQNEMLLKSGQVSEKNRGCVKITSIVLKCN